MQRTKKKKIKIKREPKYWICHACAKSKGWKLPKDACVTCIAGLCGYCDSPIAETLIPIVDYIRNGKQPIWD